MPDEFKYYAFISYSSANRSWADWLRGRLETYRIPRRVEGYRGAEQPRRFHPIFQDREELRSSWSLNEILREALQQSRFLIVICSPEAAASKWVNEEIRYFKSLGRADHLLALVIDGDPSAPPSDPSCCFPSELRVIKETGVELAKTNNYIPGAADVRPNGDGRQRALRRIIAGLLGVNVEAVVRRERRRQLALRRLNRLKVRYYATWIDRWGIPEGHVLLNADALLHRDRSLRFERQRGKLRRVKAIDSNGKVSFNTVRPDMEAVQVEFRYCEKGHLSERVYSDRFGKVLLIEEFSDDRRIITLRKENNVPAMVQSKLTSESVLNGVAALDAETNPLRYKTRVSRMQWEYDESGLLVRSLNQTIYGGPAVARDGTWGVAYEYSGNTTTAIQLGPTGSPSIDSRGVRSVHMVFDSKHRMLSKEYRGAEGQLVIAEEGYARSVYRYDEFDRCTGWDFLGTTGKPMVIPAGYCTVECDFDTHGSLVSMSFFDAEEQLVIEKEGHAVRKMEHDPRGWIMRITYYDGNGAPIVNSSGYASVTFHRDENGNPIDVRYFGLRGEAVPSDGAYEIRRRFDSGGNMTYEEYRDARQLLTPGKSGYAAMEQRFDQQGWLLEVRYFDAKQQLTVPTDSYGFAIRRLQYSDDGQSIVETIFDAAGNPTAGLNRVHRSRMTFSEFGLPEELTSFDVNGEPTLNNEGIHRGLFCYDSAGHFTEVAWLGVNGEPVIHRQLGFHRAQSIYDRMGLIVSAKTFDVWGKLMPGKNGYAEARIKYDDRGWRIADAFFDSSGLPTVNADGVFGIRYVFDTRKNVIEHTNLGRDGKRTAEKGGYAILRASFNERNQLATICAFDSEDCPCLTAQGFHRAERSYDYRGNLVETTWFGGDGKRCYAKFPFSGLLGMETTAFGSQVAYLSSLRYHYDKLGRLTSSRSFGLNDEPVLGLAGAHEITYTYNERGVCNGAYFFDTNGNPTISLVGFAGFRLFHNERGQVFEARYSDPERKLMLHYDPDYGVVYAALRISFDEHGRLGICTFLDADLKPFLTNLHASAFRKRYDARGNEIEHQFLGLDGQFIDSSEGCAIRKAEYDAFDNVIRQSQYDSTGKIIPIAPRHYSTAYKSNFAGQKTEMTYLDETGGLGHDEHGVSRIAYEYDGRGLEIGHRLFDVMNKPIVAHGYARWAIRYNEAGQVVSRRFLSTDDRLFINPMVGYAEEKYRYDDRRRLLELRYLGPTRQLLNAKNGVARFSQQFSAGQAEAQVHNADGKLVNSEEGWARRIYVEGINAEPAHQLQYDKDGRVLLGALKIARCNPFGLAHRLALQVGDIILRLGDWSALKHGELDFPWRKLRFATARLSSTHDEVGTFVRQGKIFRITVPVGPLGASLNDIYIVKELLEQLQSEAS